MIPVVTVIGTLFLKGVSVGGVFLLDQKQLTLAALCVACVAAILTGWWLTKGTPLHAIRQSRPSCRHHRLGGDPAQMLANARRRVRGGQYR